MRRRSLISYAAGLPLLPAAGRQAAAVSDASKDPVRAWTAGVRPALAISHVGFRPDAPKTFVVRAGGADAPKHAKLFDSTHNTQAPLEPPQHLIPLRPVACDFGPALVGQLPDVPAGRYHLNVDFGSDNEFSPSFFVAPDVWRRLLPLAMNYYTAQQCGVAVPGVHAACHLDDARVEATGKYINAVGGWHDAGDHVKQAVTQLNAVALGYMLRDLPNRSAQDGNVDAMLAVLRHGNRGILAQQDQADGLVWDQIFQTGLTDNIRGTADDRRIETKKTSYAAGMFASAQGLVAQVFSTRGDKRYAGRCGAAGERALMAMSLEDPLTTSLAWQVVAGVELFRATGNRSLMVRAIKQTSLLLARQARTFTAGQQRVRGFFRDANAGLPIYNEPGECEVTATALPALALLAMCEAFPNHAGANSWREGVVLYLDGYVFPLSARNAYGLVPLSIYETPASNERYRPLGGTLSYRYFFPTRLRKWWQGTTCHQAAHATLLAKAARVLPAADGVRCRALAYQLIEWVVGRNPFCASLMTGVGVRHPWPYSAQVGTIVGGVINGVAGNDNDDPILDTRFSMDWRTTEYWGPHLAYLVTAVTALES